MNERQRRQLDRLRADQAVIREAADVVRAAPDVGRWAGLTDPGVTERLAAILDVTAECLASMDPPLRENVVRVASELTGDPMDRPTVRRTRRR